MNTSNQAPDPPSDPIAFPQLTLDDLALLKPLSTPCSFEDGQTVFSAGGVELDLFVVESGAIEILNPATRRVLARKNMSISIGVVTLEGLGISANPQTRSLKHATVWSLKTTI